MTELWRRLTVSLLLALLLCGCEKAPPPRGSAQDQAAGAAARAETNAKAADSAAVEAAKAQAKANELERQAIADPTPAKIKAAADARVDAVAGRAVADALDELAKKAADEARKSAEAARLERDADEAARDLRRWVSICRWCGLIGVAAGALIGGALCYFVGVKVGAPVGGLLATTGMLVAAYGSTVSWAPAAVAGAVILGLVIWALYHWKGQRLTRELSHTIDTIEGKTGATVAEAKETLGAAVKKSGLEPRFTRMRAKWKA